MPTLKADPAAPKAVEPQVFGSAAPAGVTPLEIEDGEVEGVSRQVSVGEQVWLEAEELIADSTQVPCKDKMRHSLISLRLRKGYIAYCVLCFLLSAVVCASTLRRVWKLKREGGTIASHHWQTWETALELSIGLMVLAETLSALWLAGPRAFLRDLWCMFDACVVALTLLSWCMIVLRKALLAREVLQVDLPLLALRFVLQPCRVLSAASMVRRVRKMQQNTVDIAFDILENVDESVPPTPQSRIINSALQAAIQEHLPAWCRFREWRLCYAPHIHGSSLHTFYRGQVTSGPNVIIVQDAVGAVFGGFSTEPWRRCPRGFHGSGDCFLFAAPGKAAIERGEVSFYHTVGEEVLFWSDERMISFAGAFDVRDDFERGSTYPCDTFESPPLTEANAGGHGDFTVASFECWQLGAAY